MAEEKSGPFNRRPDKRFVKKVVSIQHQPQNWVRMNISDYEVKIMEIKKYSSNYFDFATKMNRPGYELISGYTIQNAFLMGSYMLRKEQMQMQLGKAAIKEKYLFFPINSFKDIDKICRMNLGTFCFRKHRETILTFYPNAYDAMEVYEKSKPESNPRALLYARVLLGQCSLNANTKKQFFEMEKGTGLPMNSWTNEGHDYFLKLSQSDNEIYPESILLYRRKGEEGNGPEDTHKPRLESFLSNSIAISYRSGKRYNPEEDHWTGKTSVSHHGKKETKKSAGELLEKHKVDNEIQSDSTTQAVIEMIPLSKLNITSEEKGSSAKEE